MTYYYISELIGKVSPVKILMLLLGVLPPAADIRGMIKIRVFFQKTFIKAFNLVQDFTNETRCIVHSPAKYECDISNRYKVVIPISIPILQHNGSQNQQISLEQNQ